MVARLPTATFATHWQLVQAIWQLRLSLSLSPNCGASKIMLITLLLIIFQAADHSCSLKFSILCDHHFICNMCHQGLVDCGCASEFQDTFRTRCFPVRTLTFSRVCYSAELDDKVMFDSAYTRRDASHGHSHVIFARLVQNQSMCLCHNIQTQEDDMFLP